MAYGCYVIIYDDINDWVYALDAALGSTVSGQVRLQLRQAQPEYVEDALNLLLELANRNAVIDATLHWIRSNIIAGYHGSRFMADDVASIRTNGLVPLRTNTRRHQLIRALSPHPRWAEVEPELDRVLADYGPGCRAGNREGQVHLTLSKEGLMRGFNHYLTHGAEFDQHVARELLGSDGIVLLSKNGVPTIVTVSVPGDAALTAANPYSSIENARSNGNVPNLVRAFLNAWSYRVANPGFQTASLKTDCSMVFRGTVPTTWIASIDTVTI